VKQTVMTICCRKIWTKFSEPDFSKIEAKNVKIVQKPSNFSSKSQKLRDKVTA